MMESGDSRQPLAATARRERQRQLNRASLLSGVGTIASRITGLLRLLVIAYTLGSGNLADAFNLSNNTPNMIHDLVLGGVLSATFVPVFVDRLAKVSRDEAAESISAVISTSFVVLAAATVVFILIAPAIVDLYTIGLRDIAERAVAVELLRFFAPQLLFYGIISLITAVLATHDRFVAVGIVPVVNNVVGIVVLVSFAALSHTASAQIANGHQSDLIFLGIGTTVAVGLQALALIPSLRRCGVRLHFTIRLKDPAVQMIMHLSGWTFAFVAANQVAVFVVLALATHLHGVSVYTYAFTFFQFPFAIAATSIIAIATPEIARAHAENDTALIGSRFGRGAAQVLTVILPAMVGYLLLARPAMTLILRHGQLTHNGAQLTAAVLILFALGLPGFCVFFLATRTFQAMREPRMTFYFYAFENGINIALAFALYHQLGVQGLALSYSIAYTLSAVGAVYVLRRRLGTIGGRKVLRASTRAFWLSIVMALVVAFVSAIIGTGSGLFGWIKLLITIAVGFASYLVGAGIAAKAGRNRAARQRRPARTNVVPLSTYQGGSLANRAGYRQRKRPATLRVRRRTRHLRPPRRSPRGR